MEESASLFMILIICQPRAGIPISSPRGTEQFGEYAGQRHPLDLSFSVPCHWRGTCFVPGKVQWPTTPSQNPVLCVCVCVYFLFLKPVSSHSGKNLRT